MTAREAAKEAIQNGRTRSIALVYDEGYDLFRIAVEFRHESKVFIYESKPFCGFSPQDFANEVAKRLERLGMPRTDVVHWMETNLNLAGVDCDKLFVRGLTREGRIPPSVMAQLRSMIARNTM